MKYTSFQCGKGVNKDLLASELDPGVWSDVLNIRSRNGFDESWEGAQLVVGPDYTNAPVWVTPYVYSSFHYAVYADSAKVHAVDGAALENITRFSDGKVISSLTAATTTVTVETAEAHGLTTGDTIYVYGCIPTTYNAEGVTVTVVDTTHYTYTAASAPATTPATVIGAYSGDTESVFTGGTTTDRWSGGVLNGVCLLNHPTYGLYYWNGDTDQRMRKMPNWPYTVPTVRAFKKYIFILGVREDGTSDPTWVTWSDAAEPGSIPRAFTAAATNEAGGVPLAETGGPVVDCLPLGDLNIIYKTDAIYAAQHVDGVQVFNFTRLPGSDGLLTRGAVVDTPVGHVYLTTSYDIMVHQGGQSKSIADGRILKYIRRTADRTRPYTAFLAVNPQKNEVWVCISQTGISTLAGRAFVWSWDDNTWGIFDLTANANSSSGLHFGAPGYFLTGLGDYAQSLLLCNKNASDATKNGLYSAVSLYDGGDGKFNGANLTCTMQRDGMDLGTREFTKAIQRSRWNFTSENSDHSIPNLSVSHGYHSQDNQAPSWVADPDNPKNHNSGIGSSIWANARSVYKQYQAIKVSFSANGVDGGNVALRSIDLNYSVGGKR